MRRLARAKQSSVAHDADMDPSVVNRIASGQMGCKLEHLEAFLRAIGLRVVGIDTEAVDKEEIAALRALSRRYLNDDREVANG